MRFWTSCNAVAINLLGVAAVAPLLAGCVQRRMTIRSNPPGAMVYIDDQQIGTTPVSTNFTYYGTRKFRLVKDGYETLTEKRTIPVPWYQYFPLDFVTENLVPGEIRDHRTLDFQLRPQKVVPTEEILERGEGLRRETRALGAAAAGPSWPAPAGPAPAGIPLPAAAPSGVPSGPPPLMPAPPPAWAPGPGPPAGPTPQLPGTPEVRPEQLLPYPTEPPSGWQPRG
ncbi:MAG: PEGA domain-containing protein [Thermoguttaceae bacterium]